jgi:hypothetical protein
MIHNPFIGVIIQEKVYFIPIPFFTWEIWLQDVFFPQIADGQGYLFWFVANSFIINLTSMNIYFIYLLSFYWLKKTNYTGMYDKMGMYDKIGIFILLYRWCFLPNFTNEETTCFLLVCFIHAFLSTKSTTHVFLIILRLCFYFIGIIWRERKNV